MSRTPHTNPGGDWAAGVAVGVALAALLPLVLGWRVAPLLAEHPEAWRRHAWRLPALGASALIGFGVLVAAASALLGRAWPLGWGTLAAVCLLWAALAPLGLIVALARLPRLATALAEGRADPRTADRIRHAITEGATRDATEQAAQADGDRLGAVVQDDKRDHLTRWRDRRHRKPHPWQSGTWLVLPEKPPRAVVLAESGLGKTETLRAIVSAALLRGERVVVFDLKGDQRDLSRYLDDAARLNKPAVAWPACPFDTWRGTLATAVNAILAQLPQPSGPSAYYYNGHRRALYAAGGVAPVGKDDESGIKCPWERTIDLLARLRKPAHTTTNAELLARMMQKTSGGRTQAAETADAVEGAFAGLGGLIDGRNRPNGWGWDDTDPWQLAVVSASGTDERDRRAVAMMLRDLEDYRRSRRSHTAKPLLVVIDEGAALLSSPEAGGGLIETQAEQLRSAGIGLVVAAQSVAGLGDAAPRLLTAGTARIVGSLADPAEIVRLAGGVRRPEMAHQGTQHGADLTGGANVREEITDAIDPDRVRHLDIGQVVVSVTNRAPLWAVIRPPGAGHTTSEHDTPVSEVPEVPDTQPPR